MGGRGQGVWNPSRLFYFRKITHRENTWFTVPWGLVLRNCLNDGELLENMTIKEYRTINRPLWLFLKLRVFSDSEGVFPVLVCPQCPEMISVFTVSTRQERVLVEKTQCIHSIVGAKLVEHNWKQTWKIPDDILYASDNFNLNHEGETNVIIILEGDFKLAATKIGEKISLIFDVSKKQKSSFCSQCSSINCLCQRKLAAHIESKEKEKQQEEETANSIGDGGTYSEAIEDKKEKVRDNKEEPWIGFNVDTKYGYNSEHITIPRTEEENKVWISNKRNQFNLPVLMIPEFKEDKKCEPHGNPFDPNNDNLKDDSVNSVVYTQQDEFFFNNKVLKRPTLGVCTCFDHFSGHKLALFHLGKGKLVDYNYLLQWLLR